MFDYGDSWLFVFTKSRKTPQALETSVKYPKIISEVGSKPEQYPERED